MIDFILALFRSDYLETDPVKKQLRALLHFVMIGMGFWCVAAPVGTPLGALVAVSLLYLAKETFFDLHRVRSLRALADSVTDWAFVVGGSATAYYIFYDNLGAATMLTFGLGVISYSYHWGRK